MRHGRRRVLDRWLRGDVAAPPPAVPRGLGDPGYSLPAAVGAAAGTGRPVLVVCGDGGAAYALPELATLVQERLPVCVLVVDDEGYGMLRFDQARAGHAQRGVDLGGPDWLALGTAYGVPSREVSRVAGDAGADLRSALVRAAAQAGPTLLHLPGAYFPPRTTSPRWADDWSVRRRGAAPGRAGTDRSAGLAVSPAACTYSARAASVRPASSSRCARTDANRWWSTSHLWRRARRQPPAPPPGHRIGPPPRHGSG